MKQLFILSAYNVGYGGTTYWLSLMEGGDATVSFPGEDLANIPVTVAGTFRHLSARCWGVHSTTTLTLRKNNVNTALSVTLPFGTFTQVNGSADIVSVVPGDLVCIQYDSPGGGTDPLSYSLEFEGAQHLYGARRCKQSLGDGGTAHAAALGNGMWTQTGASGTTPGDVRDGSICAVPGTITAMRVSSTGDTPGAGTFTCYLAVDGIVQDGTGGTVNTTCVLTGVETTKVVAFVLPVALTEHVEIRLVRAGAGTPLVRAAVGLAFTPDDAESFMLVGGSNQVIGTYVWNKVEQVMVDIMKALAIVGPRTFHALGLYAEMRTPLAPGGSFPVTLFQNEAATPITFTINYPADSGFLTGDVAYLVNDTITIALPSGTSGQFWWGLAASAAVAPPDAETFAIRRLRRSPHVSAELFNQFIASLQIDLEAGVGLSTGQGSDPQIMLRLSRDGGFTWGPEMWTSMGALGEYDTRAVWQRLGRARDLVVEVVTSDPVFVAIFDAFLEGERGQS